MMITPTSRQFQIMMGIRVSPIYTPFSADWDTIAEMRRYGWLNRLENGGYELTPLGLKIYLEAQTPAQRTLEKSKKEDHQREKQKSHPVTCLGKNTHYQTSNGARAMVQKVTIRETNKSLKSHIWTMEELQEMEEAENNSIWAHALW